MTRAAIYVRISRDRAGEGLGVQRQESDARQLCATRGWEPAVVFVENDTSAYNGRRRPEYERLLEAIAAGDIEAVVAWHPDRLHRSPVELERFIDLVEAHRVAVATVQGGDYDLSTASGRMTARVVGAVARHESEHKGERQRAKMAQLAAAGGVSGGGRRPFGYAEDRRSIDPAEAAVVVELAGRVLAGESLRSIALDLNARGVPTVTGRPWSTHVVRKMLLNPRLAGLRAHHGKVVAKATWPAIIDEATHQRLVATLTAPARTTAVVARRYLLSGLAYCGRCGARLIAHPRQGRRTYACRQGPNGPGCGGIRVVAEPLEQLVVERAANRVDELDLAGRGPDEAALLAAITDVEARLDQLAGDWADGTLDRRSWLAARARLDERLGELRGQLATVAHDAALAPYASTPGALAAAWEGLTFDVQRAVLSALVDRVTIGPPAARGSRFDPGRVSVDWR